MRVASEVPPTAGKVNFSKNPEGYILPPNHHQIEVTGFAEVRCMRTILALSLLLANSQVFAATLFDRSLQDLDQSRSLFFSSTLNGFDSPPGVQYASVFNLPQGGIVSAVDWWAVKCDLDDLIQITIHASVDDMPGPILASNFVSPQFVATPFYGIPLGNQIQLFSAELDHSFTASAGEDYFISIFNATADTLWGWYPRNRSFDPPVLGEGRQRRRDESTWFKQETAAFVLHGTLIPEPTSALLLTIANLAPLLFLRCR